MLLYCYAVWVAGCTWTRQRRGTKFWEDSGQAFLEKFLLPSVAAQALLIYLIWSLLNRLSVAEAQKYNQRWQQVWASTHFSYTGAFYALMTSDQYIHSDKFKTEYIFWLFLVLIYWSRGTWTFLYVTYVTKTSSIGAKGKKKPLLSGTNPLRLQHKLLLHERDTMIAKDSFYFCFKLKHFIVECEEGVELKNKTKTNVKTEGASLIHPEANVQRVHDLQVHRNVSAPHRRKRSVVRMQLFSFHLPSYTSFDCLTTSWYRCWHLLLMGRGETAQKTSRSSSHHWTANQGSLMKSNVSMLIRLIVQNKCSFFIFCQNL